MTLVVLHHPPTQTCEHVRVCALGLAVVLGKGSLMGMLILTFGSVTNITLVIILNVLLHVDYVALVLGLHLKMSTAVQVLADSHT